MPAVAIDGPQERRQLQIARGSEPAIELRHCGLQLRARLFIGLRSSLLLDRDAERLLGPLALDSQQLVGRQSDQRPAQITGHRHILPPIRQQRQHVAHVGDLDRLEQ